MVCTDRIIFMGSISRGSDPGGYKGATGSHEQLIITLFLGRGYMYYRNYCVYLL